jgi:hypothetical protein
LAKWEQVEEYWRAMSRRILPWLYVATGLVLVVGAFLLTVYWRPWGAVVVIVAGVVLVARALFILVRP